MFREEIIVYCPLIQQQEGNVQKKRHWESRLRTEELMEAKQCFLYTGQLSVQGHGQ
jgi:hypothetical protein